MSERLVTRATFLGFLNYVECSLPSRIFTRDNVLNLFCQADWQIRVMRYDTMRDPSQQARQGWQQQKTKRLHTFSNATRVQSAFPESTAQKVSNPTICRKPMQKPHWFNAFFVAPITGREDICNACPPESNNQPQPR